MVIIPAPCFYNLTITLAAHLYSLMHSMLDNVEHVQVFLKHLHTLQVRFAQRRKKNHYRHPHACNVGY